MMSEDIKVDKRVLKLLCRKLVGDYRIRIVKNNTLEKICLGYIEAKNNKVFCGDRGRKERF